MPYNEKDLLAQVSKGDELAFRELFNAYHGKLYTYILKITDSKETAEDTVSDVFLKLWSDKERLTQIQNLNAYLYRMAHNNAYNGLKRMAKQTLIITELERSAGYEFSGPDDKLVRKEVRELIYEAVGKLTPQQKAVFKMSREEGLKQEDIAQRLNISIFTVKKHLTDALNYLRKEISDSYGSQAITVCLIYGLAFC
ncbi:MAG: RNA polymerase sigma-70 factor [Ferruginibacter sp.]